MGVADKCKPGWDKGSVTVLSGGFQNGPNYGNLEIVVPGEGDPLVILEGIGLHIKLGISDGKVMGTTLITSDGFSGSI